MEAFTTQADDPSSNTCSTSSGAVSHVTTTFTQMPTNPTNEDGSPKPIGVAKRRKAFSNGPSNTRSSDSYLDARQDLNHLCKHDPHLKRIIESIRGILRDVDAQREHMENRQYAVGGFKTSTKPSDYGQPIYTKKSDQ